MDKELALLLSEMLIKQDETTVKIEETNSILKEFMGVSIKQWEEQQKFNEILIEEIKEIKVAVKTFAQLEARVKAVEEREDKFEARLTNVERILKAS